MIGKWGSSNVITDLDERFKNIPERDFLINHFVPNVVKVDPNVLAERLKKIKSLKESPEEFLRMLEQYKQKILTCDLKDPIFSKVPQKFGKWMAIFYKQELENQTYTQQQLNTFQSDLESVDLKIYQLYYKKIYKAQKKEKAHTAIQAVNNTLTQSATTVSQNESEQKVAVQTVEKEVTEDKAKEPEQNKTQVQSSTPSATTTISTSTKTDTAQEKPANVQSNVTMQPPTPQEVPKEKKDIPVTQQQEVSQEGDNNGNEEQVVDDMPLNMANKHLSEDAVDELNKTTSDGQRRVEAQSTQEVAIAGKQQKTPEKVETSKAEKPFYKQWWFYALVGGSVAVALLIILSVLRSKKTKAPTITPSTVTTTPVTVSTSAIGPVLPSSQVSQVPLSAQPIQGSTTPTAQIQSAPQEAPQPVEVQSDLSNDLSNTTIDNYTETIRNKLQNKQPADDYPLPDQLWGRGRRE